MSWKLFISHHLKEYLFLPDTLAPKAPEIYCCTFLSIDSFEVFIASVKWCVHCQSLNTTEKKHLDSSLRYKCGTSMRRPEPAIVALTLCFRCPDSSVPHSRRGLSCPKAFLIIRDSHTQSRFLKHPSNISLSLSLALSLPSLEIPSCFSVPLLFVFMDPSL